MSRRFAWAVCVLILVVLGLLTWPAFIQQRHAAALAMSKQHLKQIGAALHQYHDTYGSFPPAYVMGNDGTPWHSWRVLLLPFLDQKSLHDRYRFDEPWNGTHNRELHLLRPHVYESRLANSRRTDITTYLGVVSRRTMWPAQFCVKVGDVTDGTSNTMWLMENVASDVVWSEPREMSESDALALLRPVDVGKPIDQSIQPIPILMVDGAARAITPRINRQLFISLLTPKFGSYVVADGWPRERQPSRGLPDAKEITDFADTNVLTVADGPMNLHRTSLYCAAVQIAWDKIRPGENQPVVVDSESATTRSLNAHPFPKSALSSESYFAESAGLNDEQATDLMTSLRLRFPSAPIELLKNKDQVPGVRILVYLEKSLPFPDVMERFPSAMDFKSQQAIPVNSFGWPSAPGEGNAMPVLSDTVEIRDYVSPGDFVVLLKSDSARKDEIILARTNPAETLQSTWNSVAERFHQPRAKQVIRELRAIDHLQVPVLSFGLVAELKDLNGLGLPTLAKPLRYIADARETLRFRLDEYGAELIADVQMVVGDNGDGALHVSSVEPRRLIFDGPFLLALKEKDATVPYFLAWIGNADLMEHATPAGERANETRP